MSRHRNMRNLEKDWSEYDDGYDDDEYWEEEEWAAHAAAQPPAPAPAPAPSPIDECVRALKAMLGEEFSAAQLQAAAQRHSANFDLALNELLASRASQPNGRPGAPPQAEERRYDAGNGVLSTKEEFIEEYGGTAEWEAMTDAASGRTYYYNARTGESKWDPPKPKQPVPPLPLVGVRLALQGAGAWHSHSALSLPSPLASEIICLTSAASQFGRCS